MFENLINHNLHKLLKFINYYMICSYILCCISLVFIILKKNINFIFLGIIILSVLFIQFIEKTLKKQYLYNNDNNRKKYKQIKKANINYIIIIMFVLLESVFLLLYILCACELKSNFEIYDALKNFNKIICYYRFYLVFLRLFQYIEVIIYVIY